MTSDDPFRPPAYAVLLRTRNLAADAALVAALEHMESTHQPMALAVLLARDHDAALAKVVAGFCRHEGELRELLIRHADQLAAGARLCIADERWETRQSAIELIRASGACKLAYLLGEVLTKSCRKTSALAAQVLLALVDRAQDGAHQRASSKDPQPRSEIDYLASALQRGLASWPLHFRTEVVLGAARLAEHLEQTILGLADNSRLNVSRAFNNLLGGARDVQLAAYCLRVLRAPRLREAVVRLLATSRSNQFREALLGEAWLLADDDVRRSCARIGSLACLEGDTGVVVRSGTGRVRSAANLIAACGLGHGRKLALLRQLVFSDDPAAERAGAWTLIDHRFEGGDEALKAVAARAGIPLSQIARIELCRRRGEPFAAAPLEGAGEGSAVTPLRAERAAAANAFEPYWMEFDSLEVADRVAIGRTIAAQVPEFEPTVRAKWAQGAAADRIRTLQIIRELGLTDRFEEVVYKSARDADSVVRSIAVALLAVLPGATSQRLLHAALDDPDDRVQANAIEALEGLEVVDKAERIACKLESGSSRVRANAAKALLHMRVREGAVQLLDMLSSEAGADRVSALWVVERMRLAGVVARLARMADSDPDPRVRRRARRVFGALGGTEASDGTTRTTLPAREASA